MDWIRLHASDSVAVVLAEAGLAAGANVHGVALRDAIPRGHKVALVDIGAGGSIIKFGHIIGVASRVIRAGEHVHVHNVSPPPAALLQDAHEIHGAAKKFDGPTTFKGFRRKDGTAGTRNYLVVASSVNCSATVVKAICRKFEGRSLGIDGVVPVTHNLGCAQEIGGLGYRVLNRTLAGWIFHPNVVGAVVVGLGCEGTSFKSILETKEARGASSRAVPLEHFDIQSVGGTAKAIEAGVACVEEMLDGLPVFSRETLPVSQLGIALNCGGSDGYSAITANPALGIASDILVSNGGMVSLAEIPECHGAEELLLGRAKEAGVRDKLSDTFRWWLDYAERNRVQLNDNLAPGNIEGGISTIVEKSLGSVAKGGSTPLTQVVDYAEPITERGFTLMNTPGFDPVSVTGLVAGGCNLVAFTTGRGSVYGCGIAPTVKIATQSKVFRSMGGDMDFNAGRAIEDATLDSVGTDLYKFLIDVASGQKTCSEQLGLGWEEFVPWPLAETL